MCNCIKLIITSVCIYQLYTLFNYPDENKNKEKQYINDDDDIYWGQYVILS